MATLRRLPRVRLLRDSLQDPPRRRQRLDSDVAANNDETEMACFGWAARRKARKRGDRYERRFDSLSKSWISPTSSSMTSTARSSTGRLAASASMAGPAARRSDRSSTISLKTSYPVPAQRDRRGAARARQLGRRNRASDEVRIRPFRSRASGSRKSLTTAKSASCFRTTHDITALKRAQAELAAREAHLRSILDTVPEAMIVIDEQGQVTSFSAAAANLFGYRPER